MNEKHVLPIVMQICRSIDNLFVSYVGPVGGFLCEETFEEWNLAHWKFPII